MHRCQEVVFAQVEHVVVNRHARGDKFGDAAFHQLFGEFRVFELLADCHAFAGTHQLGQIGVEGVVWKSCQLNALLRAIGAAGECESQNFGGGILAVMVGWCIFGGGRRIIRITSTLVPFMGMIYVLVAGRFPANFLP